ncbi:hypothetical protein JG687_00013096 [Phytophthora cactorum]|uniref:Uncharacterized protein n=1 Tax=Phytophthora cactorum TaxID=29920 RepID=A0A8T1TZW4_9STRA|nr:hypothetical protein JG687_00013096 [Phytophthora cactorum]
MQWRVLSLPASATCSLAGPPSKPSLCISAKLRFSSKSVVITALSFLDNTELTKIACCPELLCSKCQHHRLRVIDTLCVVEQQVLDSQNRCLISVRRVR